MSNTTASQIFTQTMQRVAPLPCQEGYARNLAKILSVHLQRSRLIDEGWPSDELPSMSAIIVAPTGQGKTYLVRKMAESVGLHLITIDCSTLVPEGYKGVSLSQRIAAAATSADNQVVFEQSVLFFDEVDKLQTSSDVQWGTSRMANILQLFNGGTIETEIDRKAVSFSTDRFLLLFGGAFVGLEGIIRERLHPRPKIGFSASGTGEELTDAELMEQATLEDLTKFGLMPELLGRIGSVLSIRPMELEDYRQLLTAEHGSLKAKYGTYLELAHGVNFEIAAAGVEEIAARCMKSKTGARAATPLVNDMMRSAISAVEDEATICTVILDANEDGCFIRYEHGERMPVFDFSDSRDRNKAADEAAAKLPVHKVKRKNEAATVRSLLRYYRNADGKRDVVPKLEAFLGCVVQYLHRRCRPSEFTILSMVKLAEAVQKHRHNSTSSFDIIMSDAKYTKLDAYKELCRLYDIWTARELVAALQLIQSYMDEKHGPCQVLFVID